MRYRSALALATLFSAALLPAFAQEAEVVTVVGKGEARESPQADWRPAVVKQKLKGGAFVRTGDMSQMALLMQDQTQLRLNQNSMLQIREVSGGAAPTKLDLKTGRAWMQSKGTGANVVIDTPNATAAIRGTDWELEVDPAGKTLLAVFSGTVEFSNPQGSVSVGKNEGAVAEFGKAPIKIILTAPRDRIQWVNALSIEPQRYLEGEKNSPAVKSALESIAKGDLAQARTILQAERGRNSRVPEVYMLLADIEMMNGEFARAMAITDEALNFAPRNPELLAQLVREQLLADKVEEAKKTLARPRDGETAAIVVASGETARREGNAPQALSEFTRATRADPKDDRGWFSLGRAQNEREDVGPARRNLTTALQLNPNGPGYQGELGTLETFGNRFTQAEQAFNAALQANAGDYVAYTGLGLLRLKRGDPQAALDAFLKAGVIEPRYARAKTYTAIAYYQLGRHSDAIATMKQAAEMDDKDPLPYMYLTQIYTDLFRAGEAVEASREAVKRLPYLKSLNQVANNQQGTGNVGYSLAFFGLEEWAVELAQQAYSPYSATSHLFLADRYRGQYNRNSELFQGFLTDPTAFGGSNRFASLVPTSGMYGTLGLTYSRGDDRLSNPYLRLNGLGDWFGRSAYFLDAESGNGTTLAPDSFGRKVTGDRRAELYAVGLGDQVTENIGLFAFGTKFRDEVLLRDLNRTIGTQDKSRVDAGMSYRFSPTSMTWLKFGRTNEQRLFDRYTVVSDDLTTAAAATSNFSGRPSDIQLRHSMDITPADHLSVGAETAKDRRLSGFLQAGIIVLPAGTVGFGSDLDQDVELKSKQAYASYTRDFSPVLSVQGDIFWQQFEQRIDELQVTLFRFNGVDVPNTTSSSGSSKTSEWNPRLGFVYKPDRFTLRGAYQKWRQPASTSSISPVATAGIELDDRLVSAGGKGTRGRIQFHSEIDGLTQVTGFYDDEKVRNLGQLGFRIPTPQIQFVELLRNAQIINVATADLLEGVPDFDSGRLKSGGLAINRIVSNQFAVGAKYIYSRNKATIFIRDENNDIVTLTDDARIPFIPKNLASIGVTWSSPNRIYFSAQAVYRSDRYTDRDNTTLLASDTTGSFAVFYETADKRLIVGAGAANLWSKAQKETYQVDIRYRY